MRRAPASPVAAGIWILGLLLISPGAFAEEGYVGDETCLTCHEDLMGDYAKTIHAKVFTEANARTALMRRGCEACHGPGEAHVEAGGGRGEGGMLSFRAENPASIEAENAVCLTCHSGGEQLYWKGSVHDNRDMACTSCHSVMKQVSDHDQLAKKTQTETCASCHLIQRSRQFRRARMPQREGHMDCGSCHNPHGTPTQKLISHNSVNDNCLSCHADKRGPFLWEHAPVTESCLNCHLPHGSTRPSMLKLTSPRLCQQCHIASRHPGDPREPDSTFVVGGACMNCHISIHGSNHPSGYIFGR